MTEEVSEFPNKYSSGSSSVLLYSVEARVRRDGKAIKIIGREITHTWLSVPKFPICVAENEGDEPVMLPDISDRKSYPYAHHLMDYAYANALRWILHAALGPLMGLETRIVKHVVKVTHEDTAEAVYHVVRGDDRSDMRPDFETETEEDPA